VFDLGWSPVDINDLSPPEILYWFDRAAERAKKQRR
jgi:hypothetical protein